MGRTCSISISISISTYAFLYRLFVQTFSYYPLDSVTNFLAMIFYFIKFGCFVGYEFFPSVHLSVGCARFIRVLRRLSSALLIIFHFIAAIRWLMCTFVRRCPGLLVLASWTTPSCVELQCHLMTYVLLLIYPLSIYLPFHYHCF